MMAGGDGDEVELERTQVCKQHAGCLHFFLSKCTVVFTYLRVLDSGESVG